MFFNRTYSLQVWLCLILMLMSALFGAYTDAQFHAIGYTWQAINCFLTAAYSLYLSGTMDRVKPLTETKERMSEFSMVYYNNLLSLGPILILIFYFGEYQRLPYEAALMDPAFQTVAFLGGLLGFGISFSSLWYLSRSTATVYSVTGSLNKIIVAVLGILLFNESTAPKNLVSIAIGLLGGILFVLAKAK